VLLRASASTGFRAPSLQQAYFSSTYTDFVGGVPTDISITPAVGPVGKVAGLDPLKEEKSRSFTLGATWTPNADLSVTADLYYIKIKDRIVLSGLFDESNYPTLAAKLATLGVGGAQFFVNSVDTKTGPGPDRIAQEHRVRQQADHLPGRELQQDRSDRHPRPGRAARL